jgi:hypothetical protein
MIFTDGCFDTKNNSRFRSWVTVTELIWIICIFGGDDRWRTKLFE